MPLPLALHKRFSLSDDDFHFLDTSFALFGSAADGRCLKAKMRPVRDSFLFPPVVKDHVDGCDISSGRTKGLEVKFRNRENSKSADFLNPFTLKWRVCDPVDIRARGFGSHHGECTELKANGCHERFTMEAKVERFAGLCVKLCTIISLASPLCAPCARKVRTLMSVAHFAVGPASGWRAEIFVS